MRCARETRASEEQNFRVQYNLLTVVTFEFAVQELWCYFAVDFKARGILMTTREMGSLHRKICLLHCKVTRYHVTGESVRRAQPC
jgi:hypothetical protein